MQSKKNTGGHFHDGISKKETVERLRRDYPVGCRVVLDCMDDPYTKLPIGGQGVCRGVDDAGNILVSWDCGSSLSVAYGADRCHRIATESEMKTTAEWLAKRIKAPTHCPRCGRPAVETNRLLALSIRADVTICDNCGSWEGLEDAGLAERKPLREWSILQEILTEG